MKTTIAVAVSLASLLSFAASAATLVSNQEAQDQNLESLNQTISITGKDGDQVNARQCCRKKADAQGASHYRIIENHQDDTYHITAELYK